jgi:Pro-kumamolisin, activation domain/Divergent InlB B-repeat domain
MQICPQWKSLNRPNRQTKWRALGRLAIAIGALAVSALAVAPSAFAQNAIGRAQALVTQAVNENNLVTLAGNTRPEARNSANDRGRMSDSVAMPHLLLQLRRPAAQEQALEALIGELHDPHSPNYHRWLNAGDVGTQFGPAPTDITAVTDWLQQHGFTVNSVYPSGMVIDFSGTVGQVTAAFHTEMHNISVNGTTRFANMSNPQIPAALAPAVVGVVALHNIPPRHYHQAKSQYTAGGGSYLMTPSDLATIYNFNPLYAAGDTGQGQTIYLLEDTDLYSTSDWSTFRSTFGLSGYTSASLTTIHPALSRGGSNCTDPGVNDDDDEAILDAEWASAAAPSATIVMVSCTNILAGIENLVNTSNGSATSPAIMSISYGECEASNGSAANAAFNSAYQQGAAEGFSIFVSAGDNDAAVCDDRDTVNAASHGIAVNGWASTPYNVAVGGTDFSDTFSRTNSTFWNSSNTATYGSARSYIPEIPWNNSCASQLIATYVTGSSLTYGSSGFCNSSSARSFGLLTIVGGSGGPSTVYGKPSWQSGLLGNPADGVRDLPDVSLFAANGVWGHYYVFCLSDPNNGGNGCSGAPSTWNGAGGTSFSAPIFAGIQALVNQYTGSAQGNPNPVYYQIANTEYGASGSSGCNSNNGNTVSSSCIFYDIIAGDNDADCTSGSPNCYLPSGTYGVLSTSTSSYAIAYDAGPGWDFATGLGTVNVYNLVKGWASGGGDTELLVGVTGSGTVTSSPTGINCPSTCAAAFHGGPQVTLIATPTSGWTFSSWAGACSGSGNCTVAMTAAQSVTATFLQNPTLSVSVTGSGTVMSSPAGINCPSTCSATYAANTQVTLTAAPANNWSFEGWGGPCSGVGNCVVTMNAAQSVTATFAQTQETLNVSVSGSGTVNSSPSGISCPSVCTMNYASGTTVTLSAAPSGGATFSGWGGACSGNGSCMVTMNQIESVTAMFSSPGGSSPMSRTWVSASLGNDANPCTRSAPCLTFAAALALTTAGGEIDVLDPGDFGPVTIAQSVSIEGYETGPGGPSPTGTSGITIAAGANDVINLRGLALNGFNGSGTSGIVFNSGARLNIRNCLVQGFQTAGITFAPGPGSASPARLFMVDTIAALNGVGLWIAPTGGIAVNATLRNLNIDWNTGDGLRVDGTGGSGTANVVIADSSTSFNGSNGIDAISGPGSVIVTAMRVVASGNGADGVLSNQSNGGTATVAMGSALLDHNAVAAQAMGGASLLSYDNNEVTGNTTNGSFSGTTPLQ